MLCRTTTTLLEIACTLLECEVSLGMSREAVNGRSDLTPERRTMSTVLCSCHCADAETTGQQASSSGSGAARVFGTRPNRRSFSCNLISTRNVDGRPVYMPTARVRPVPLITRIHARTARLPHVDGTVALGVNCHPIMAVDISISGGG